MDFNVSSPVNLRMCFDVEDEISSHSKHSSRSSPTPQKSIKKRINLSIRKVIWNSKRDSISTWPINSKHIENRNVKKGVNYFAWAWDSILAPIDTSSFWIHLVQLAWCRIGSARPTRLMASWISSTLHQTSWISFILFAIIRQVESVQLAIRRVGSASSDSPSGDLDQSRPTFP